MRVACLRSSAPKHLSTWRHSVIPGASRSGSRAERVKDSSMGHTCMSSALHVMTCQQTATSVSCTIQCTTGAVQVFVQCTAASLQTRWPLSTNHNAGSTKPQQLHGTHLFLQHGREHGQCVECLWSMQEHKLQKVQHKGPGDERAFQPHRWRACRHAQA